MNIEAVGRPYRGVAQARDEGSMYTLAYGEHELVAFVNRPTLNEMDAFQNGKVDFGYWWDAPVIWLIFRIDGLAWSEAPYTVHMTDPGGRNIPHPADGRLRDVTMILADATTSRIAGMRIASMSQRMAAGIHRAAREQLVMPFDQDQYDNCLQRRFDEYASAAQMAGKADLMGILGVQPASEWPRRN